MFAVEGEVRANIPQLPFRGEVLLLPRYFAIASQTLLTDRATHRDINLDIEG